MVKRTIVNRKGEAFEVILDEAGANLFDAHTWCVSVTGINQKRYIVNRRKNKRDKILFHRELLGITALTIEVDHINNNCLDNRVSNLRLCSKSENQMNARKRLNQTSKFKGVSYDISRGKWKAQITVNQKSMLNKRFSTETEAAEAYNKKATELFGQYAKLNVIL